MAVNLNIPDDNKIFPINGIEIAIGEAGIKKNNKKDLTIFKLSPGTNVAGIFTKNLFKAAPVIISEKNLANKKQIKTLIINTGNANAGTGSTGIEKTQKICTELGKHLQIDPQEILTFSTGVVMEQLPEDKIINALPKTLSNFGKYTWKDAAYSIMTTDTKPKIFSEKLDINGKEITVTGISKGAGMICPNMATMLGFIGTDIQIEKSLLDNMIKKIADFSFNRISVDGDTSTNDSFIIMCTGKSGLEINDENDPSYEKVFELLKKAAIDLAQKIVRDAEGATKFITINVEKATNSQEALKVAYAVAHSPLVKTAFYASDPNIGRILVAVGYSDVKISINNLFIWLNDVLIVKNGEINPDYIEYDGKYVLQQKEIIIRISLNQGKAHETIYTCDLSHEYITINADYRS
ncbi:MAG: bifunctional glutamate N-acetyltransferase/amino-acid acetyltransferase ArgJ [Candidatus Kinetoplastibacterium crithidii]|nr:MAG: bifunctional glutamate N-acetyltransferase/amino-acid acetyltransferase ArgJ [Candidatus Kinetoplastibacterium crithidii]